MTTVTGPMTVEEAVPEEIKPKIEMVESEEDFGRFVAEPLERGFGVTLGNALRRVLLSSLTGAAITSIRIEGVQHEYSTIPLVKEDVSELLVNIKAVRLAPMSDRPGTLRLDVQGPGRVTAGDIQPSADFEIQNPELYLASMDSKEARLPIEFQAELGKGYRPATHTEGMPIGVLPVDAIFTPVRKVNYSVEKTRVGQITDYDRLVLEVWTDGTKTPSDAVREGAQILVDSFFQFVAMGQVMEALPDRQPLAHAIPAEQYNLPIERLDLSARTLNCLKRSRINKIGEVLERSQEELLKIKNFGEKSLTELYDRLRGAGLLPKTPEAQEEVPLLAEPEGGAVAEAEEREATVEAPPVRERATRPRGTIRDLAALRAALLGQAPEEPSEGAEEPLAAEQGGDENEESTPGEQP